MYFRSSDISDIGTDFDTLMQLGMLGMLGEYPSISKKYLQLRPLASPHDNEKSSIFIGKELYRS